MASVNTVLWELGYDGKAHGIAPSKSLPSVDSAAESGYFSERCRIVCLKGHVRLDRKV
jgi:hypothetical protein